MKRLIASISIALLFGTLPAMAGESDPETPVRQDADLVILTAKVVAINHLDREVTIEDQFGKQLTLSVDESVKRLGEVEAGDSVKLSFYTSIAYELREPTAEELENPLQIVEGGERAAMEELPGATGVRIVKAVCTIEGLDRPTATVTLKGPLGRFNVVEVKDVNNLPKLRIGQSVVVTYAEAVAVSLEKVAQQAGS